MRPRSPETEVSGLFRSRTGSNSYDYLTGDDQTLVDWTPPATDPVANVMQLLRTMTDEDRSRMQQEMGGSEEQDFRSV